MSSSTVMMANPNTVAQAFLASIIKTFSYDSDFWKQKPPSGLLRASPNPHGYKTFFDVINPGIKDYQTAVAEDQALLAKRTWAVTFAEDYIAKLEAQDGGWGTNTAEIVDREQTLLPVMRRKVLTASARLQHSQNLLSEFQLIHRLLTSIQSRIKPKVTAAERDAIDRGLGMIDSEWAKLQTELTAASACKERDGAETASFFYRWYLVAPDGSKQLQSSDACLGPIEIGADLPGYTTSEPLIGPDATQDEVLPAKPNNKKKKGKMGKSAPLPSLSDQQKFFAGRVFSDDGVLALDTEVVRVFSHDHRRDYWGWGVRHRAGSF